MHIAASKPLAVAKEGVPAELVEQERAIAAAKAAESASPRTSSTRWSRAGREVPERGDAAGQPFVKDDKETVASCS